MAAGSQRQALRHKDGEVAKPGTARQIGLVFRWNTGRSTAGEQGRLGMLMAQQRGATSHRDDL